MQKKGSYSNYDGKDFGRILEFCPVVLPHSPHADITSEHEIHLELFLGLFFQSCVRATTKPAEIGHNKLEWNCFQLRGSLREP